MQKKSLRTFHQALECQLAVEERNSSIEGSRGTLLTHNHIVDKRLFQNSKKKVGDENKRKKRSKKKNEVKEKKMLPKLLALSKYVTHLINADKQLSEMQVVLTVASVSLPG